MNRLGPQIVRGGASLTAGLGTGLGYVTLAENNAPELAGDPVALHIVKIVNPPEPGFVQVINPDNVFDERVVLRHSLDFGGNPDALTFEWFYQEDQGGPRPVTIPTNDPAWIRIAEGTGLNHITIGGTGARSISDGWIYVRYKGYAVGAWTANQFTDFGGGRDADGSAIPAHYDGWIKRVLGGLNAFDQRSESFHDAPAQTYVSMLQQAGQRYEGPVAFNPGAANVNSLGLIELYETVLRRGFSLTINGTPSYASAGVNNALLLAAGRISDFYMLLGNEAFQDAQDPTIGFNVAEGPDFGTLASSVFAFQNQLPTLLDEELALLRGRDNSGSGVGARPVYNRLFWNFTNGLEGEPAYVLNYVTDQNFQTGLTEEDAAFLYPQGHGDAWGHYLSATKSYYRLMRHPNFTWIPRSETVTVAGVGINVDYLDEVKFARAAAAKARTGRDLVDLVYRERYESNPAGQWQGYKDPDAARAWGMDEWARRSGQAALFDWAIGNALLPEQSAKTGLEKIDRQTVTELGEIAGQFKAIQQKVDNADRGLNPLGLTGDTIPFDIDPSFTDIGSTASVGGVATQGLSHFEQIYLRAQETVKNALGLYNFANEFTQRIRALQLKSNEFAEQVFDADRDFKSRLIEIYGYPYSGDIGPGNTYPDTSYDGPDLYRYMYVNVAEYAHESLPEPGGAITGYFGALEFQAEDIAGANGNLAKIAGHFFPGDVTDKDKLVDAGPSKSKEVTYPLMQLGQLGTSKWRFQKTAGMGERRAPGKLQVAISAMVSSEVELAKSVTAYNEHLALIQDAADILQAQFNLAAETIRIKEADQVTTNGLLSSIVILKAASAAAEAGIGAIEYTAEAVAESIPDVTPTSGVAVSLGDGFAALAGGAKLSAAVGRNVLGGVMAGAESGIASFEAAKESLAGKTELAIEKAGQPFAIQERLKAVEQLLRAEIGLRLEVSLKRIDVQNAVGEFLAVLAEGERLQQERIIYNQKVTGPIATLRYQDLAFRNFRNDALQKYRASFDLAARYVYTAARAYDYETCLLGSSAASGQQFLQSIVRQRSLGQFVNDRPINGVGGLSDPMARMLQNFTVLKGQLGFNTPQLETGRFSLRTEFFRIKAGADSDAKWAETLQQHRVADLWKVPEFRRYCRPFSPENAGAQPGLVISFGTDITFGQNFFGWPLAGGDSSYDSSHFATKIKSVGVWFANYNGQGLAETPRVYLVPVGTDIMRTPVAGSLATREFTVVDQRLPVPFPFGEDDLANPDWIPVNDSLSGNMTELRRFGRFRAYHDSGSLAPSELAGDTRLIGRSVWNTRWLLIIPGGTFLNDPSAGLDTFIKGQAVPGSPDRDGDGIKDIKIFFRTYAYPGL